MPTPIHPAQDPTPGDPYEGLPEAWSDSVKETYVQIEADNPNLGAAELSSLYEACALFALADALEDRVNAEGYMIPGSKGQTVAHPLLAEVRMNRLGALAALRAIGIARNQSAASAAGAALAAKRHHGVRGSRGAR